MIPLDILPKMKHNAYKITIPGHKITCDEEMDDSYLMAL